MAVRVCVIGPTGVGKSALCNLLCGKEDDSTAAFPVSDSINACTYLTTAQRERWFGLQEEFILIDTPGLGDTDGRDTQHIASMVRELKQLDYVNAFLVVFNSQNPRMDEHLRAMLDIFASIFSNDFLKNVILVFTRWEHNKKADRKRQKTGESRGNREREFNGYFRNHFHIRHSLPAVFIDNYPDNDDPEEHEATRSELRTLKELVSTMEEFKCEDAQVVRGHLDELKNNIEEQHQQYLAAAAEALDKAKEAENEREQREQDRIQHEAQMSDQQAKHIDQMQGMQEKMDQHQQNWNKEKESLIQEQRRLERKIKRNNRGISLGPLRIDF